MMHLTSNKQKQRWSDILKSNGCLILLVRSSKLFHENQEQGKYVLLLFFSIVLEVLANSVRQEK